MSPTAMRPEDLLEVTQTTAPSFLELGGRSVPIARSVPRRVPSAPPLPPRSSPNSPASPIHPNSSGKILAHGKGVPPLPIRKGLLPLPKVPPPPPSPSPPSIVIDDSSADPIEPEDENATIPLPMEAVRQQLGSRPSWPSLPALPAIPAHPLGQDPLPTPAPGSSLPRSFDGSITLVGPPRPARRAPPSGASLKTPAPHTFLPPPPIPGQQLPPPPITAATLPMPQPPVHPIDLESMTAPARYRMPGGRRDAITPIVGTRASRSSLRRALQAIGDAFSHPVLRSRGACAALGVLAGISIAVLYNEMYQTDLVIPRPEPAQSAAVIAPIATPPKVAPAAQPAPKPIPKAPAHIGVVMPEDETAAPSASSPSSPR